MNKKQIRETIAELRKHSPDLLDETGDCPTCNGMVMLSKEIGDRKGV
ncbi:hypothetical protein LCGC14_2024640 [marine sediment metagenome]|uniref:Uncharacterized protein n=1 Tax=marine sediment metagenome TaxID=412755 RepID=A0A0F9EWI3_9ZZZZ